MVTIDLKLPKNLPPGAVLQIDKKFAQYSLVIGQDRLSILPNGSLFAVTGLTGKPIVYIHGTVQTIQGRLWSSPRIDYFVETIAIDNPPLQQATNLRLPSSIWKTFSPEQERRMQSERQTMQEVLQRENASMYLDCWKTPLRSSVSSPFASPRILPAGNSYYHTGLDLRAAVGYPVRAVASSTVALAEEHFVPGRVVVLDHGGGLFSRYMHLNVINVKAGDHVNRGDIIGRTGATGRVEAPHLHWEVLWKGNYADPQAFLQAWGQICDPKLGV